MPRGGSSPAREKSLAIIPGITTVFFRIMPRYPARATAFALIGVLLPYRAVESDTGIVDENIDLHSSGHQLVPQVRGTRGLRQIPGEHPNAYAMALPQLGTEVLQGPCAARD